MLLWKRACLFLRAQYCKHLGGVGSSPPFACGSPVQALVSSCARAEGGLVTVLGTWHDALLQGSSDSPAASSFSIVKKPAPEEVHIVISWLRAVYTLTENCSVIAESQRHQRSPLCPLSSSWTGCTPTRCTSGCPFSSIQNCSAWSIPGTILNTWEILGKEHLGESSKQGKRPVCESSLSGGAWEKLAAGQPLIWALEIIHSFTQTKIKRMCTKWYAQAWRTVSALHCFLLVFVKLLSQMTLLFFSLVDIMSYSHTKVWCKSLAIFVITVFAKSIACDMWPIVKFLHFPVFANCQCVVSSTITPTLASNYHRRQCVMLQLGPDPVSIWFSGQTKPKQKSPKNPTHLGQ